MAEAFIAHPALWVVGVFGALLTAFYMFRLYYLTFHGTFRGTQEQQHHLHESPKSMTIPLIVLAVCSILAGFINVPAVLGGNHWLDTFLQPLLENSELKTSAHAHLSHTVEYILMGASVFAVLLVIGYARLRYLKNQHLPASDEQELPTFERILSRKWYVDEIYDSFIVKPFTWASVGIVEWFDKQVFERLVNGTGQLVMLGSRTFRFLQSGNVGFYVFAMVFGVLIILIANSFLNGL